MVGPRETFRILDLFILEHILTVRLDSQGGRRGKYNVIVVPQLNIKLLHRIQDLSHGGNDVREDHRPPSASLRI
jgi:hypothetical protein